MSTRPITTASIPIIITELPVPAPSPAELGQPALSTTHPTSDVLVSRQNLQTMTKQEEVRQKLTQLMLGNLKLPPGLEELRMKNVIQCVLIAFFHDLEERTSLPPNAVKAIANFLGFLDRYPFAKQNGVRFQDMMRYLETFPKVKDLLNEPDAQKIKQALKFFLTAKEFKNKTLAEGLLVKIVGNEKKTLDTCLFLVNHLQLFVVKTLSIMDAELDKMKQVHNPSNSKRELDILNRASKRAPAKFEISFLFSNIKQFFDNMERLFRTYQGRKKLFEEQFNQIQSLLEEPASLLRNNLIPTLRRFLEDLSLLDKQIARLKKGCHGCLDEYNPCLTQEQIAAIEKEENPETFVSTLSVEERKEEEGFDLEVWREVQDLCGNIEIPLTLEISRPGNYATPHPPALPAQQKIEPQEIAEEPSEKIIPIEEVLTTVREAKEHRQNVGREEFQKFKQKMVRSARDELEIVIAIGYRNIYQLLLVLKSFERSCNVMNQLLTSLEQEALLVVPQYKVTASDAFASLFVPPKIRPRWRKTPLQTGASEFPAESSSKPVKAFTESAPLVILPSPGEKKDVRMLFSSQQFLLFSPGTLEPFYHAKASREMIEFAQTSLRHTLLQHRALQSTVHLLGLCTAGDLSRFLPYLTLATVRSCSIITEQSLTARVALSPQAEISHDHVHLAEQLNFPLDNLTDFCHGVISHRYPHSSEQYLKDRGFPLSATHQWILNPGIVQPKNLINLITNTLQHLQTIFPHIPQEASAFLTESLETYLSSQSKTAHSFSPSFKKELKEPLALLEECLKTSEKLTAFYNQENSELKIARILICKDILTTINLLKLGLECWIGFPSTTTLLGLGDNILTLSQFLDEHIEKLVHLQNFGLVLTSHDLENYRAVRECQETPEHEKIIAELNIEYGAQYPHRYRQDTGRSPTALTWRLRVAELVQQGETVDKDAIRELQDRKKGYSTVKEGTKQTPAAQHPLFGFHEQIFRIVKGVAEMAESRLKELEQAKR